MKISTIITGPELLTKVEEVSDVTWASCGSPSQKRGLKYPCVLCLEEIGDFVLTRGVTNHVFARAHISNDDFLAKCKELVPRKPKTVKIEIEVEVPDWAEDVGVDRNGEIYAYEGEVDTCIAAFGCIRGRCRALVVKNWRDTLTKVNKE